MQHSKEKVPKKGARPSASVLILMAVAATTLMSLSSLLPLAYAQGTPRTDPGQIEDPDCWGEVNSQLAQVDDGQPGEGEHVSDPLPNRPGHETPRDGVGNQDEDHPALHGETVSTIDGIEETGCVED